MGVGISARFGKDDELYDGLTSIADDLIENPHDIVTAVVTLRPKFSRHDFEKGVDIPTVRVVTIEPILDPADVIAAKALQRKAFVTRTGNNAQASLFEDDEAVPNSRASLGVNHEDDWDDEPDEPDDGPVDDAQAGADAAELVDAGADDEEDSQPVDEDDEDDEEGDDQGDDPDAAGETEDGANVTSLFSHGRSK